MWLTKLELKPRERRLPFDTDMTHRFLTAATDSNTYLWASPRPGLLIVQSERPLNSAAVTRVTSQAFTAPRRVAYHAGQRLSFAGILAPTQSTFRPGKRGKIRTCTPDETPGWFAHKLGSAASVDHLTVEDMSPAKGNRGIIHPRASFTGTLTVSDPKVLADILTKGIGRGKRFGTGLLLTEEIV